MIDSLVRVAEKIAEWSKYREERAQVRFKQLVAPTFQSLKAVHSDYLSFIEECLSELKARKSFDEVFELLQRRRLDQEAERRAIEHQAFAIREDEDFSELRSFFFDVEHYFKLSPFASGTASNMLRHSLGKAIRAETTQDAAVRKKVISDFEGALQQLRYRWDEVARSYAECLKQSVP